MYYYGRSIIVGMVIGNYKPRTNHQPTIIYHIN